VTLEGQRCDLDNFRVHYLKHGLRCRLDSFTMGHLQEILKNSKHKCKKTVVYHLVNGSTVLLDIENSKNDRLKVILLGSTLIFSQTATSNTTFSLSFLLFSMPNNTVEPLTRSQFFTFILKLRPKLKFCRHPICRQPRTPLYQNFRKIH